MQAVNLRRVLLCALLTGGSFVESHAGQPPAVTGTVRSHGADSTIPGADVSLVAYDTDTVVAATRSDVEGRFQFDSVSAGRYLVRAAVPGLSPGVSSVFVVGSTPVAVDVDVPLTLVDSAVATASAAAAPVTAATVNAVSAQMIDVAPVKGDDFSALLTLVPGVLRGADGRLSMKGGRPAQTGLQLGHAYVNDPATGDAAFNLPIDAIDVVRVVANPYAAESGRFSAGQASIETRAGTDRWQVSLNNFIPVPCLRICDGESLGVRAFDPRFRVSGPLVPGRVRMAQSFQFHRQLIRIPTQPDAADDLSATSLYSFTRLDATASAHEASATLAVYPLNVRYANLSTFVPREATVETRQRGYATQVVDQWRLSPVTLLETTIAARRYDRAAVAEGTETMVVSPQGVSGNAFNDQDRRSHTLQWVQSLRTVRQWAGDHVLKGGVDLLYASFDGTSISRPVEFRAADGTLRERVESPREAVLSQAATDFGVYVQDLWRMSDHVMLDGGLRLDAGSLAGTMLSPRAGAIVSVRPDGRGILRGGAGLFVERMPLMAGAFEAFEPRVHTVYDAGGSSTLTTLTPRLGQLAPARALVWNLQYDHKFDDRAALRVNHLRRRGSRQLLVEPVGDAFRLSSSGRSRYRETEVSFRRVTSATSETSISYVNARSEGDLNTFDVLFGEVRVPAIRTNAYGRTAVDVPHRLIALVATDVGRWRLAPLVEWRSGFPYAPVDDAQQFVGVRNARRFPAFWSLDLTINREVVVRGHRVRIGARANHVLRNSAPRDVQLNTGSPSFGTFYNSIVPKVGLTIELTP